MLGTFQKGSEASVGGGSRGDGQLKHPAAQAAWSKGCKRHLRPLEMLGVGRACCEKGALGLLAACVSGKCLALHPPMRYRDRCSGTASRREVFPEPGALHFSPGSNSESSMVIPNLQ